MSQTYFSKTPWIRKALFLFLVIIPALLILAQLYTIREPIADYTKAILDSEIYDNALEIAKKDHRVIDMIGEVQPIDVFRVLEGDVIYAEDNTSIDITVGLRGSKKKGKLDIKAQKVKEQWQYELIRVRIKKPKKVITVIERQ